ncbi:MAG: hypothetical protein J6P75_02910 [Bacteroidales bacterium]|nr:hypothetical protein [Bacteroidales bacterium]
MQKNRIRLVAAALAGAVALSVSCQKEVINPPSLTAFSFKAADNAVLSEDYVATISGSDINVALPDVDKSALVASFTVADGNIVKVNGAAQTSGKTANNFSSPVTYVVTDSHDENPISFKVNVTLAPDKHPALLSFAFEVDKNAKDLAKTLEGEIKGSEIGVAVPQLADVTELVATFTTGTGNKVTVNGVEQVSGVTVNDFSNPVDYMVTNLDGSVNAIFSVTLNRQKGEWTAGPAYEAVPVHAGARILVNPVDDVPYVGFKRHQPTEASERDPDKDEKMYAIKLVDGAWVSIGEAFSDKVGSDYDFILSPTGTPFFAFKNAAVSPQVTTVMKYDNGSWVTVGDNLGTAATSKVHLHAIADNKVVVCQIMSNKTFVGVWDGAAWTTGGMSALTGDPRPWEIRMAGDGENAYMFSINRAKALDNVNYGHNVMKFNGTEWSGLRQNFLREGATQTSIVGYDITVAPDGTVYLVTGDNAEDNEKYHHRVEKYNAADGTWSQVGSTIDYVLSSRCYSKIAVAPDGTPFLVYPNEESDPKTIEVIYFDNATKQWSAPVSLGTGGFTGDPNLSLAFDSKGKGYVTWLENSKLIVYTFE